MPATLQALARDASGCVRCPLSLTRTSVVFGAGDPNAALMFVGEAPGQEEDRRGEPFVGRSGQLLERLLGEELGLGRGDVYIANVVKCHPPANRDPHPDEIAACRPYLDAQVALIDPRVVVTLGNFASRLLLETKVGITKLRGQSHAVAGRTLIPTFHPAAALRGGAKVLADMRSDFGRVKAVLAS